MPGRLVGDGFGAGRNRQVQSQHFPSAQAGAAGQAVPAADHLGGDAEVLGYALDGVSLADVVAGNAARVGGSIASGMLADRQRDDQLGIGFEVLVCLIEVIGRGN